MSELNLFTAFVAGLVSFLAPCTFSAIPIFLTYISGVAINDEESTKRLGKVFRASLFYAFGFILFFSLLGLGVNFLGGILYGENKNTWKVIGGILLILIGLYMLFMNKLKIEFLMGEKKIRLKKLGTGNSIYINAFILGFVNAFAWTPCIGPIYGAVSTLSLTRGGNSWLGFLYLVVYSIGVMIPFILTAMFFDKSRGFVKRFSKYTGIIYRILAIVFIIFGILIAFNLFDSLVFRNIYNIFKFFGFNEAKLPL